MQVIEPSHHEITDCDCNTPISCSRICDLSRPSSDLRVLVELQTGGYEEISAEVRRRKKRREIEGRGGRRVERGRKGGKKEKGEIFPQREERTRFSQQCLDTA